MEKLEKGYIEK